MRTATTGRFGLHAGANDHSLADRHARTIGSVVLLRDHNYGRGAFAVSRHSGATTVLDPWCWDTFATRSAPLGVGGGTAGLVPTPSLDQWGQTLVARAGADLVLTPSRLVRAGDWPSLKALVDELGTVSAAQVVPFLPLEAAMLDPVHFAGLVRVLRPLAGRQVAFLFAGPPHRRSDIVRLGAVRALVGAHFPGSWLTATGLLQATDAVAHGAGIAFVGVRGGLRRPGLPGDPGGFGDASRFMPGTLDDALLEMRTPDVYSAWYISKQPTSCQVCGRRPVSFKSAQDILEHNIHGFQRFEAAMCSNPPTSWPDWLDVQRRTALDQHQLLSRGCPSIEADPVLRSLCELDDPLSRQTTRAGAWT